MQSFFKKGFEISNSFTFNAIVSVDELSDHDMIYIYHHLKVGSIVRLTIAGTNVKGDLRYRVAYKNFVLGFVTLSGSVSAIYENSKTIESEIVGLQKQKFLPINGIDISLQATKMRMVS
tara:strand:+ start:87 stop:443 length:357 start_codon:yes stop_codon:yes gene_type:complete